MLKRWMCLLICLMIFPASLFAQEPEYLVDLGFRPDTDGFSFQNYGGSAGYTELTSAEVARIFGEEWVCYYWEADEDGSCELTTIAEEWMNMANTYIAGGHCEGMAALSIAFYSGYASLEEWEVAATPELEIESDEELQRELAYWWALQMVDPTYRMRQRSAPMDVIQMLIDNLETEFYTIAFWTPEMTLGHAVTPYAVVDAGDGFYHIMIYDNNFPGEERYILVDGNTNSWSYTTAANPDEPASDYVGNADTLNIALTPMEPRMEWQECHFCGEAVYYDEDADYSGTTTISLNGSAHIKVTDKNGNTTSFDGQTVQNNIPGAQINVITNQGLASYLAPIIYLPHGVDFNVVVEYADDVPETSATALTVVRPGSFTSIQGLSLEEAPGELEVEGSLFDFHSDAGSEEFEFRQALSAQSGEDYLYVIAGSTADFTFGFDPGTGEFAVDSEGDQTFSLYVEHVDAEGISEVFEAEEFSLVDGESVGFDPSLWTDGIESEYFEGDLEDTDLGFNEPDGDAEEGDSEEGDSEEGDSEEDTESDIESDSSESEVEDSDG